MHQFHMDVRSPIDLTDVPKPTMAPLDQKGSAEGNMLWMSFGYGYTGKSVAYTYFIQCDCQQWQNDETLFGKQCAEQWHCYQTI